MSDKKFRYFQFIAGERRGEIVILDRIVNDDNETFLEFKDGSRMNTELVAEINVRDLSKKLMAEIDSPRNPWKFEEAKPLIEDKSKRVQDWSSQEIYEAPSADEIAHADLTGNGGVTRSNPNKKKIINLIPPAPTRNKFGKIANSNDMADEAGSTYNQPKKVQQQTSNKPTHDSAGPLPDHTWKNDPVWLMMDKAKKFDTEVEMTLIISLPSKSLFDVANESFEDGGVKVIEYIIHNLDDTKLKNSLKEALFTAYGEKAPADKSFEMSEKEFMNNAEPAIDLGEPKAIEEPVVGDIIADASSQVILVEEENNSSK